MSKQSQRTKEIFVELIGNVSPEQWEDRLIEASGGDQELLVRVRALLRAHAEPGSFLQDPAVANQPSATEIQPITEKPGSQIGPYKLLQQIGEGGFGVVYMAEQKAPVKRRVALKIIKPGMDTKEVIARFEAERQALAMMDHPHIAKVFDAGATETGRPYFVMELVKAVPLTMYCDKNHHSAKKRLELFIDVCHAIQHAHQKGVIHRDLKPSNIMVTLHDGKPVVKVIDFGISKALNQQLTEKTFFTAYGEMVGTPAYMSPEQAEMSGLDIDTRSDVYSLGVLLYELLTGTTPFDSKRLHGAGYAEMQRIIREEEPPKPSTRVTTLGEESTVVSSNRGTDPKQLGQFLRGDLDWIVMKSLDKERHRRYETANGFAADIGRFLRDEPVVARPPSAGYKFLKFARRNKASLVVASVATLALIVVAIGSLIAAGRFYDLAERNADLVVQKGNALNAERALRQEAQHQSERAAIALQDAKQQRRRAEANFGLARRSVDTFLNRVVDNELLSVPGLQPLRRELLVSAQSFYEALTKERAEDPVLLTEMAEARYRIGMIHDELGDQRASAAAIAASIRQFEELWQNGHDNLNVRIGLARGYLQSKRFDKAIDLCESILQESPGHVGARDVLAETYIWLAKNDAKSGKIKAALAHHRRALALQEDLVREHPEHPQYLSNLSTTLNNLGTLVDRPGNHRKLREALAIYEQAATYAAQAYEKAPHSIRFGNGLVMVLRNIATTQSLLGMQSEALDSYRSVTEVCRKMAYENPAVAGLKGELCQALRDVGRYECRLGNESEAILAYQEAKEILKNIPHETSAELFELASIYAYLALPPADSGQVTPPMEREQRARDADLAMQTLRQAVEAGFNDFAVLQTSEDFNALRDRDEFQQLLARMEEFVDAIKLADSTKHNDKWEGLRRLKNLAEQHPDNTQLQLTTASTAHAIGLIETRLGCYESAEQAFRAEIPVREALRERDRDNARFTADLGAAQVALGDVYWKSQRIPDALDQWEIGLELLDSVISASPGDESLKNLASEQARTVFERFAEIGLWERAVEFRTRDLRLERAPNSVRFAILLLAVGDLDGHRRFSTRLHRHWADSSPLSALWAVALSPEPILARDELIQLADRVAALGDHYFISSVAALGYYRAGEYQMAFDVLQPLSKYENSARYSAYLLAMIQQRLDRQDEARRLFENAERDYQKEALDCLNNPRVVAMYNTYNNHRAGWWELAHAQVLRREAWQVILGHEPPGDPWQHAIQSRAWELLGDDVRADEEFAAALTDYDALIAQVPQRADRLGAERGFLLAVRAWKQGNMAEARRAYFPAAAWWLKHSADNQDLASLKQTAADLLRGVTDEDAVRFFSNIIAESPDLAELYQQRAAAYARLGRFDEAAEDFIKGLELAHDERASGAYARPEYQKLMPWDEVFNRVAALRPTDSVLRIERGRYLAWRGEWHRAAEHYSHVLDGDWPLERHSSWLREYACLLVLTLDDEKYRAFCRRLTEWMPSGLKHQRRTPTRPSQSPGYALSGPVWRSTRTACLKPRSGLIPTPSRGIWSRTRWSISAWGGSIRRFALPNNREPKAAMTIATSSWRWRTTRWARRNRAGWPTKRRWKGSSARRNSTPIHRRRRTCEEVTQSCGSG
jgi:serine/threonine protein kinase/tetratricopeptide (TPR) repeat protein